MSIWHMVLLISPAFEVEVPEIGPRPNGIEDLGLQHASATLRQEKGSSLEGNHSVRSSSMTLMTGNG
jgi:hypothetical protein